MNDPPEPPLLEQIKQNTYNKKAFLFLKITNL